MTGVILCNGYPPGPGLLESTLAGADLFIAADGGGNSARELGHRPDLVIGDLDSYENRPDEGITLIEDPDQETNDLEKALAYASRQGISEVTVLGVTGQRIDQTLKNLSVMIKFNPSFSSLVFRDDFGDTFLISSPFERDIEVGTTVSLLPLSGRVEGITTRGLQYPLNDEPLENGFRVGSSNLVTSNPVEIRFRTGNLLLFVGRDSHRDSF